MSREHRKGYYSRDRDWERDRGYRSYDKNDSVRKRSRSPGRGDSNRQRRSRSPRKSDKDLLDDNILNEISKLPNELWDNQFQDGGGSFNAPPPPSFPESVPTTNYGTNYQTSYSGIYDDFPSVSSIPPAPLPPDIATWNQMSLPPPPAPAPPTFVSNNVEDQIKKEAAIESEMRHQKAALSKQREDYIKKSGILKKELDTLKDQRNELRGDSKRSPSPDTKRFLKENTKLQLEIQNKLKTINNVVDMLNGIIGEEAQEVHDSDDSTERSTRKKSRSPANKKFNYIYYDPEMHWCRVCNEFPSTAKDYLNHLHSPAHHKMASAHMEAPWHTVSGINEGFPNYPSAVTKRTPIRGLQFFVPSTAWYCKLCDQFIGDLHCASAHLKSIVHSKNYTNFVEQNPHWETDWMSDRQKAFEKSRATTKVKQEDKPQYTAHTITFNKDGFHTKRKDSPLPPSDDKKKKKDRKKKSKRKHSTSSSSSSNSSSSDSEPAKKKKKSKKEKVKIDPDDKTLNEWMSSIQMDRLNETDRKLLDTLKSRIKRDKQDEEKRRSTDRSDRDRSIVDLQRKLRETERRDSRAREDRDRREENRRRDERRDERRNDRSRASPPRTDVKKPEIKKMPFIGKMPVFKHLTKNSKTEEQKKEEQKKKEEQEATKKRREEMDVEIQKKVAEFKQKIAKAQLERQQAELTPLGPFLPPVVQLPPAPAPAPTPAPAPAPAPTPTPPQPPAALPKDFQDALDIIFPSAEAKNNQEVAQPELFGTMPPGMPPGFSIAGPLGGVIPPFPPMGIMQPQMPQMMMGFEMNTPMYQQRPQLYDAHVPLVPSPTSRQNNTNKNNKQQNKIQIEQEIAQNNLNQTQNNSAKAQNNITKESCSVAKKKEELDDLAMLGIDASDVGAGF